MTISDICIVAFKCFMGLTLTLVVILLALSFIANQYCDVEASPNTCIRLP